MNLNRADGGRRKYILVEMGEHFNTVILPRIKKVAFSDKWKDGKASGGTGMSHFVKYYDLESYEDVLRRARYADADLFNNPYDDPYHSYVFLRDLKLLEALRDSLCAQTGKTLASPPWHAAALKSADVGAPAAACRGQRASGRVGGRWCARAGARRPWESRCAGGRSASGKADEDEKDREGGRVIHRG